MLSLVVWVFPSESEYQSVGWKTTQVSERLTDSDICFFMSQLSGSEVNFYFFINLGFEIEILQKRLEGTYYQTIVLSFKISTY